MKTICSFIAAGLLAGTGYCAQAANPVPSIPEAPGACALLSRLDVEEATGISVGERANPVRIGTVTSCSFSGEHGGQVMILFRRVPNGDWVSQQIARMSRGVQFGTYREVPGLRDRSFLYPVQKSGAVLCVFREASYLQVSVYRMGEDARIPAVLQNLATRAFVRLLHAPASARLP